MNLSLYTYASCLISLPLVNLFKEGGVLFMSLILTCLLLSVFFIVRGVLCIIKGNQKGLEKHIRLTTDASLLGLVLGFLGSVIGLISAFDFIEAQGNVSPEILAGGLKVSLLTATFGLFSFTIARFSILVLRWFTKEENLEK